MKLELHKSDPLAASVLWTGRYANGHVEKIAILRAVSELQSPKLHFDLKDRNELSEPPLLKKLFLSIRAFSLTASLTPALVTWMIGVWLEKWISDTRSFLLCLLALAFLQIAVNILNDVEDHLNLVDLPGDIGGSGVIQRGWLSARTLSRVAYGSLVLAIGLGLIPLIEHWKTLAPIAIAALVGTLGYSGMGFRFKYRAMGDLVVFLLCGPFLSFGVAEAAFGRMSATMMVAGLIFGLAAVGILHANNLNDLEVDSTRGAKTVANQIGFKSSKKYLNFIYLAQAIILGVGALHWVPLWFALVPGLALISVGKLLAKVRRAVSPLSPSIAAIRFEASQIHLMIGLAWVFSFLIRQGFAAIWPRAF